MAPRNMLLTFLIALSSLNYSYGEHHMKWKVEKRQNAPANIPLIVTNQCRETIHPGILTQSGTGPSESGFKLPPGESHRLHVSQDWQGRVWGRTNCSFNDAGQSTGNGRQCTTGDCGPFLQCKGAGENPTTLAEFTLAGAHDLSYYDISLVDGYNLPLAIVLLANSRSDVDDIPPNQTNPSCVASAGNLGPANYNPYGNSQKFLGTNASYPLPFNPATASKVSQWCPWDLQVAPPAAPGDGVYPYPDSNVARPAFSPCYSACAKYNEPAYCCTGKYDGPSKCSSNYYSKAAKAMCPDAYSFAYDDQDSTFSVPEGAGFEVVLCPGGLSTNILATSKGSGEVQHSGRAADAARNVFMAGKALTDGMALKAVAIGSLGLAFMT